MIKVALRAALLAAGCVCVCVGQTTTRPDDAQEVMKRAAEIRPDVFVLQPEGKVEGPAASQPDEPPSPMQRLAGPPTTQPIARRPTTQPTTQPATQPDTTADLPLDERGPLRLKLGKYELAEKDLQELLKDERSKVAAALGLAELYRRTGRHEDADKMLAGLEPQAGRTAGWRCEKAELLAVRGGYEEALKLAGAVLDDDAANLRARWIAGQQLEALGRTDEAKEVYKVADEQTRTPPPDAPGRTYAGLILDRYSRLISKPVSYGTRILQDLYQEAYENVDRQYWPARVAAGYLSLTAYKTGQAAGDFAAALKINPAAYEANLGLGWAALADWRPDQIEQAERQIAAARKVNPKDPAVFELEAAVRLMDRDYEAAVKAAEGGLQVNPRHVACLGLLASAHLRLGNRDKVAELTRTAEAVNPRPAEFYYILGEWQAAARQFDAAEGYFRKAIELAPWDPNPMTSLGMMYMQTGHEKEAGEILEKAFAIDRYNRRSFNTLQLLDQLVAFDVLESTHFIVKFNRTSDAILGPYFRDYLESIYSELSRDYNIDLPRKTIVEVFPSHDQFSVRTTGRPWVPTVGACTGWVVAMYSPRDMVGRKNPRTGEPMGFNWARVLRHEFTHVVTLAATGNRIPHWMTEGLAVHQEHTPRQWKWVQMLTAALRQNQLFEVNKLDWGFVRPRRMSDRELAYAQSQWMVEFIIAQYGYKTINEMLVAFRDYRSQPRVFKDVLGVSETEFDKLFRDWAARHVKEEWRLSADKIPPPAEAEKLAKEKPSDASAKAQLAESYFYARRADDAERLAREALAIDPKNVKALTVLGELLADPRKNKWDQAKPILEKLAELDPTIPTAPRHLARKALASDNIAQAIQWFNRLKLACPYDTTSYMGLAGIHLDQARRAKDLDLADQARHHIELAMPELSELARRELSDPRYALRLATLFSELGKPDQAAIWLEEAIRINPFDASVHEQLAVAFLDNAQPDRAIAEMKVAVQLKPDDAHYWARLAFIYDAHKQPELARKAADVAVKLNPDSPAREILERSGPTTRPDGQPKASRQAPTSRPDRATAAPVRRTLD